MRKGLGHSRPFGKRKSQRRRVQRKVRRPRNVGYAAKMEAERKGGTVRGRRRAQKRGGRHTGPYTPEHHEGHNGQGKLVRPGGPTKETQ